MTVHQEFTEHLLLAIRWLRWNGKQASERQALKLMEKYDVETLRRMLQEAR